MLAVAHRRGLESFVFIYLESLEKIFVEGALFSPLTLPPVYSKQRWAEREHDPGEVAGLRIVKYPHPSLRTKNAVITEFTHDLQQLSRNMFEVRSVGVGMAPCDVGNILFRRLQQLLSHDFASAFNAVHTHTYT